MRPGPRAGQRTRRTFTAAYKARMLAEYDRLETPGARGALLRREGLYYSHIQNWRKAAQPGPARPAGGKKAGAAAGEPPESRESPESPEMRKLKKENARLHAELARSQAVTQALGKLAGLLETLSEGPDTEKS